MRIIQYIRPLLKFPFNMLSLIVLLAFAIRVYNLNFNSIFIDEAFYVVIGQKILEGRIDEVIGDISWVGAFPFFYPFFSGVFYSLGGILATRFFNVILGAICIGLIFNFTKELRLFNGKRSNEIAGLVAASFMATTTIPIEASRLAIYDGLSFTLLLLGLNFYLIAINAKDRLFFLVTGGILFLSFLAKYIVAILFPFIFLSSIFLAKKTMTKKNLNDVIKFLWSPLLVLIIWYAVTNSSDLINFFSGQIGDSQTTYLDVAKTFWKYSSVAFIISFFGALFLWDSKKMHVIGLYLLSIIPILVHVITKNDINAHQHSFLTLIFLFPLIGASFTSIIGRYKKIGIAITVVILTCNLLYSVPQIKDLESFWPNTAKAALFIKDKVSEKDIILAEGGDTIMLSIDRKIPSSQIVGPFVFDYQGLENEKAYIKAIEDGYFKLVELENTYFSTETFNLISTALPKKYVKIFDDGRIQVYERKK